ncbi:aspartate kinase [Williamwhitmania taraxaci]|uniref:Aspartokinase n=1 Tax=Williamwhitmania taraxaci TaxID=1640674 RepID=A0A1G6KWG5_9BACT|nr:aspartate kinase [Williamwhitmania taraxaci]SDC34736.1 aspartate kinase [Williamwhitmania taraxaci]
MRVLKFGGTSVGTAERIRTLITLIPSDKPVMVVLSAMAGTTNALVEIANIAAGGKGSKATELVKRMRYNYSLVTQELYESAETRVKANGFTKGIFTEIENILTLSVGVKEERQLLAYGEILSTNLFYLLLQEQGIASTLLNAVDFMRIDKDGEPIMHRIAEKLNWEIQASASQGIFITQGFICRNADGEIDNLNRGGSDYTAAIIGNAIDAQEVQIWTDIDGFHNNDPRFVSNTRPIRQLSFDEAAELAYFGAKILHPATIHPCRIKNIPVLLKNTLEPSNPGTLINATYSAVNIKAVAAKDAITAIKIRSSRMLMAHGFLKKVFDIFDTYKTPVDMITTSEVAVSLTIDNAERLADIVRELEKFSTVEADMNQTIICIVGDFVAEKPGVAVQIFNALRDIPLRMISYGGSSHNISLLVRQEEKIATLQAIQLALNVTQPQPSESVEGYELQCN